MKKLFYYLATFALIFANWSCTDYCEETRSYRTTQQVSFGVEQIRLSIANDAPQALIKPGKIYVKDNYLFVNEIKKGIHIYDNSNPSKPVEVSFLKIPGNVDMAVKENTLYADSYVDLVALDITNPKAIKEIGRVKEVFPNGNLDGFYWYFDPNSKIIYDYESKIVTETIKTNCGNVNNNQIYYTQNSSGFADSKGAATNTSGQATSPTGTGGSTARFTIYKDFLYTVSQADLMVFDIKMQQSPIKKNSLNLGWGIETIFPYKDKLFIGSNTGMYIFDNKNPEKPERVSIFQHARACDPVVVEGNTAFVTLRTGVCGVAPNQLDVIDITNLSSPSLLRSYQMQNPHGLGVSLPNLFICEGTFGLKSMDASNIKDIKLLQQIEKINAYDVIPLDGKHLIMVGSDGLYQYDYSDAKNLKQLSVISVQK